MSSISDKNFYTYLIKWSKTGKWYYGVRYAKNSNPKDLWKTYLTSSKYVELHRKEFGDPDIIQIRKTFNSSSKARKWENTVLKKLKVLERNDSLNQTTNLSISPDLCSKFKKGKTYEEIYGKEKAKELRDSRSKNNRENIRLKNGHSNSSKMKMSTKRQKGMNPKAKSISFRLDNQIFNFECLLDAHIFLVSKFDISISSAKYVIDCFLQKKEIPARKNYQIQKQILSSITSS